MFNYLKRLFKKDRYQEAIVSNNFSFTSTYGLHTPENYNNLLKAYTNETYVYACVYIISTTIAGLPYLFYKKGANNDKIPVKNKQLEKLFEYPNDNDENSTWYNLIEWTLASLELTGNAYWLLDRLYGTQKITPAAMQLLLADRMRVLPNTESRSDNFVNGYVYLKDNGAKLPFTDNEITHFKYIKPDSYYYGQGSVASVNTSIDLIREAEKTNLNLFVNGALPYGSLETDKNINDDRFQRLQREFDSKYGRGSRNAGKTMLLDNGLKFKKISESMKDLEFIEGIKLSRESICSAFGVPPVMIGILDKATYSNYEQAVKIFWIHTLIPKLRRLEQVITHIVRRFEPEAYFGFDVSNIDALKENQDILANIAQKYFNMGVPMNDIIKALNLPFKPIEGGDIGYIPFSLQPIGMAAEPEEEPAEEPEVPEEIPEAGKSKSWAIRKEFLWKQFDNNTRKIEIRYRFAIDRFFTSLGKEVISNLTGSKSIDKGKADSYMFDKDEAIKQWAKESGKFHKLGFHTNGRREIENLGMSSISFDIDNPNAVTWLKKYALKEATLVVDTAFVDVKAAILTGFQEGEGIDKIAARVAQETGFYGANKYKAQRIAQTEVIASSNAGALEAYKQSGLKLGKGWLGQMDDRIRDTHIEATMVYNEKNLIPLDEDFKVGGGSGPAPCQINLPEESVNCRCSLFSDRIEG